MRDALYQQVYERVLDDIRSHRYPVGSRLASEAELREELQVSAVTVKRALNMLREEGYIDRRPRRGTYVVSDTGTGKAPAPSRSRTPLIGAVMSSFDDSFGTPIVSAFASEDVEVDVLVKESFGNPVIEERLIHALLRSGVDGLILEPTSSAFVPPSVLRLVMEKFPVVIIDRAFDGVPVSSVVSDNVAAGAAATQHLIELGHTSLGLITASGEVSTLHDRQLGFLHAHATAHIPHEPRYECDELHSTIPGTEHLAAADIDTLRAHITAHPEITGFVATEHNLAVLLREALRLEGRSVPEDASIVSFDYPERSGTVDAFRFSHIDQDQVRLAGEAIRLVTDQIAHAGTMEQVVVPASLEIADSTAAIGTGSIGSAGS